MILRNLTAGTLTMAFFLAACVERSGPVKEESSQPETEAEITVGLERTPSPEGARVFFISPASGDVARNPLRIEFGIEGMSVVKAGDAQANSGHHHLLIDTDLPDLGTPVPADANHVHFGDGRSSTEITLEPGEHTLRLLLADYLHIPHDPPVFSDPITITVE